MECGGMGWDETGWNGMRWNGTGWAEGTRFDGMIVDRGRYGGIGWGEIEREMERDRERRGGGKRIGSTVDRGTEVGDRQSENV